MVYAIAVMGCVMTVVMSMLCLVLREMLKAARQRTDYWRLQYTQLTQQIERQRDATAIYCGLTPVDYNRYVDRSPNEQ